MSRDITIDQSAEIKMALASGKQVVIFAPTSIVHKPEDEALFRHFPREALERLNEILDDTSGHVPMIARLAYMLTLPSETYHRSQTDVARMLGLPKRVVNYQLTTYFPQACPRKTLKET